MSAGGRAAGIDFRGDAGGGEVTGAHGIDEGCSVVRGDEVDGATAEASTGEARAKTAGLFIGEVDEGVNLGAGGFEVVAEAKLGFVHELAEAGEVGGAECFDCGQDAVIFGDNVAATPQGLCRHLAAPEGEVLQGGVAEGFDFGPVGLEDVEAGFHLGAPGVVCAGACHA